MAHTKAKGTTKLGRDSESKRLGVKIFGRSPVKCGQIIIRQRGTKYLPGENVKRGNDDTLYATCDGIVVFKKINYRRFNGNSKRKQIVSVKEGKKDTNKPNKLNNSKLNNSKVVQKRQKQIEAEMEEAENRSPKGKIISEEKPPTKGIPRRKEKKK